MENAKPVAESKPAEDSVFNYPKIPNIHQALLAAVSGEGCKLEMDNWHKCGTTHCRGGWIVTLAGEKGKRLEAAITTEFAAMMIYQASSPIRVSPVRFYEGNDAAMKDIERCAAEEKALGL